MHEHLKRYVGKSSLILAVLVLILVPIILFIHKNNSVEIIPSIPTIENSTLNSPTSLPNKNIYLTELFPENATPVTFMDALFRLRNPDKFEDTCPDDYLLKNNGCWEKSSSYSVTIQSKLMKDYIDVNGDEEINVFRISATFLTNGKSGSYVLPNVTVQFKSLAAYNLNIYFDDASKPQLERKTLPQSKALDDQDSLTVNTDLQGRVSIAIDAIQHLDDRDHLFSSLLFMRANFMNENEWFVISPSNMLVEKMLAADPQSLIRDDDDRTLFRNTADVDLSTANSVVQMLQNILSPIKSDIYQVQGTSGDLEIVKPDSSSYDSRASLLTLVYERNSADMPPDVESSPVVRNARLVKRSIIPSSDYNPWMISFDSTGMSFHNDREVHKQFHNRTQSSTETDINTALQMIKSGGGNSIYVEKYNVDQASGNFIQNLAQQFNSGLKIVVKGSQQLIHTVVRTMEDVFAVIVAVFQKLQVFVQDIAEFFVILFDWKGILNTAKFLENHYIKMIGFIKVNLLEKKNVIGETMIQFVADITSSLNNATHSFKQLISGQSIEQIIDKSVNNIKSNNQSSVTDLTDVQINRMVKVVSSRSVGTNGANIMQAAQQKDTIISLLSNFFRTATDFTDSSGLLSLIKVEFGFIQNELAKGLSHASMTIIFDHLNRVISYVSKYFLIKSIELVLAVLETVILVFSKILQTPLQIPLIKQLFQEATGNMDFSMLSVLCVIGAIPSTVSYRIIKKDTLLTGAEVALLISVDNPANYVQAWMDQKDVLGIRNFTIKEARNVLSYALGGSFAMSSLFSNLINLGSNSLGIMGPLALFAHTFEVPFQFIMQLSTYPLPWFFDDVINNDIDLISLKFLSWVIQWFRFIVGFYYGNRPIEDLSFFSIMRIITVLFNTIPSITLMLIIWSKSVLSTYYVGDKIDLFFKNMASLFISIPEFFNLFNQNFIDFAISGLPMISSAITFSRLNLDIGINATFSV